MSSRKEQLRELDRRVRLILIEIRVALNDGDRKLADALEQKANEIYGEMERLLNDRS